MYPFALAIMALVALHSSGARGDSLAVVPPVAMQGPFPVACSDVTQDFSRLGSNETAAMYWAGAPAPDGRPRYITDLLLDPNAPNAPIASVVAGPDSELFSGYVNQRFNVAYIICYPTSPTNMRADYVLPTGSVVPRMQRGPDGPIFPSGSDRYPVVLLSHGSQDSPLLAAYLDVVQVFASHGYVVIAPFHGDPRFADVRIENFEDAIYALLHLRDFVAMEAVRPLGLQEVLRKVMGDPFFAPRIDPARIVGLGASLGAQSLLLQAGAGLTVSLGLATKPVTFDPNLRAVVGYVPYFGVPYVPSFGRGQHGLDLTRVPFLAIGGTADVIAPLAVTEEGVRRLRGSRGLVALQGLRHGFDAGIAPDFFTWSLSFFEAHASGSELARARAQRMTQVAGGGNDVLLVDYTEPLLPGAGESFAVEFHHAGLDHYFVTADAAEVAMLDAGMIVPGWSRTGYAFKAWVPGSANGLSTCRFVGTPGIGPSSHFFTLDAAECAKVRGNPFWTFEAYAFQAFPPSGADCPADRMLVTRMYNNGQGGQANHRYVTSHSEVAAMKAQGWIEEGPVFCTPA